MESSKDIQIKDMDNNFRFRIHLFTAEKGLDFIDAAAGRIKTGLSIKPFLDDLLPLISLLDATGTKVVKEGMTKEDCFSMFQNPLTIIELGFEVFKFQEVFLKSSETFRPLIGALTNIWNTKTSGSATPSAIFSKTE